MADEQTPTFAIPKHPTRTYRRRGGVKYDGETVFSLLPDNSREDDELRKLVVSVLDEGPYQYGDWFNLPMPLYLVHDEKTGDTFRVGIRDGVVELHVLPATEAAGLRAFYERISETSKAGWDVTCRTE